MSTVDPTKSHPISQVDNGLGAILYNGFGAFLDPIAQVFTAVMDKVTRFDEKKPDYHNEIPTIVQLAHKVFDYFADYHKSILTNSSEWAREAEAVTEEVTKWCFNPLTFSKTGEAIQKIIAEKITGKIALAVTFCVLQIFHIMPYLITSVIGSGTLFIYHTAPVALITFLAGSMLMIQIYFIIRLNGEVKLANKILADTTKLLDQRLGEFGTKLWNFVTLPVSLPLDGLRYVASRARSWTYRAPVKKST